jgi:hypothetical protein
MHASDEKQGNAYDDGPGAQQASVEIVSPVAGGAYVKDAPLEVRWRYFEGVSPVSMVVAISYNNGFDWATLTTAGPLDPEERSFTFEPNTASTECIIKIYGYGGYENIACTVGPFTIE